MAQMTITDLRSDLTVMLSGCSTHFEPQELDVLLTTAAEDLARRKSTMKRGTLTLVADQRDYAAPSDILTPLASHWGQQERGRFEPWEDNYPQRLPRLYLVQVGTTKTLEIDPPPSGSQIANLGSDYLYTYAITHTLSETEADTTVPPAQRGLLLLRALAEAMKTLAARGVHKPVSLGAAGDNRPKNGAPASLADQFMKDFIEGCRA